ncbi:DNA polymerase III subunit epsilon [Hyphomicrobiales bacterium]|jgi:DNA polymerase-3 subunit epsilon|nr:DNA polymerase III subunit epsilon [Hyphomicrobiales bacterium]MDC3272028.1 DNA polymerase III subunit epsilon [Hyphomicrobiales bacterium]|tara:strand:- start:6902 stop:7585 length:684 start_codon:yes stop_codon:yes gene_type:complete
MREIVLDTETTGLDPKNGDKVVEIACVELINHIPTGKCYQTYINPKRDMPEGAFKVHGLTEQFLSDKPIFGDIVEDFLFFIEDSILLIHNAKFDMNFLNHELTLIGLEKLKFNRVIDTLQLAREKHPGSPNSLDALCRRYSVDNNKRDYHDARLDCELLAEVYMELIGGRQHGLLLDKETEEGIQKIDIIKNKREKELPERLSSKDLQEHKLYIKSMHNKPLWDIYN